MHGLLGAESGLLGLSMGRVSGQSSGPAASTEIIAGGEGGLRTADIRTRTWPMGLLFPNHKLGSEVWQRVPADSHMDVQHDRCVVKMPAMLAVLMFLEVTS